MPANFSAVSENEMTYVIGGGVADYLTPVMEAKQWQNFSKNMVTIVGNKYLAGFGKQFGDIWATNYTNKLSDSTTGFQKFKWGLKGAGNVALNVVGNLAAIYNLGFGTVKNAASESTFVKNGDFAF